MTPPPQSRWLCASQVLLVCRPCACRQPRATGHAAALNSLKPQSVGLFIKTRKPCFPCPVGNGLHPQDPGDSPQGEAVQEGARAHRVLPGRREPFWEAAPWPVPLSFPDQWV